MNSDDAETTAFVQRDAGLVLREDASLQGPDTGSLGFGHQRLQERSSHAATTLRLRHVDADLGDTGVDTAT